MENMSIKGKIAFLLALLQYTYGVGTAGENFHKSLFKVQNSETHFPE